MDLPGGTVNHPIVYPDDLTPTSTLCWMSHRITALHVVRQGPEGRFKSLIQRPFRKDGDGTPTSPPFSSLKRTFFTTFVSKIDHTEETVM